MAGQVFVGSAEDAQKLTPLVDVINAVWDESNGGMRQLTPCRQWYEPIEDEE
jgi:hypothetical protein